MTKYLLIGSGRTARHFSHYFQELGLKVDTWSRKAPEHAEAPKDSGSDPVLNDKLSQASHVLVLISDSQIENFFQKWQRPSTQKWIHFSGALEIPGMISAHPLMTFSEKLYDLDTYRSMPFIITSEMAFSEILPDLPNSSFRIRPEQKALYHAYCVSSGNFTTLLWMKMSEAMKSFGLPGDVHLPYMQRIFQNLLSEASTGLTGPLARKDLKTVLSNEQALASASDPLLPIYQAFVQVYFPEALETRQAGEK